MTSLFEFLRAVALLPFRVIGCVIYFGVCIGGGYRG